MTIRSFCKSYSFYLHCRNSKARLESEPCSVSQATRTVSPHTEKLPVQREYWQRNRKTAYKKPVRKTAVLVPLLMSGRQGGRGRRQRIYTADTQRRYGTYFFCLNTCTTGAHNGSPLYPLLSDSSTKEDLNLSEQ